MTPRSVDIVERSEKTAFDHEGRMVALVDTGAQKLSGWYRLKLGVSDNLITTIRIETTTDSGATLVPFAGIVRQDRFTGYLYLGSRIRKLTFEIGFSNPEKPRLTSTMRRISFLEKLWLLRRIEWRSLPRSLESAFGSSGEAARFDLSFAGGPITENGRRYREWIRLREAAATRTILDHYRGKPAPGISILLTVCDPPPVFLKEAIQSVTAQTSGNWQLCITDDASENPEIRAILTTAAKTDQRIRTLLHDKRQHISASTNSCLSLATMPFVTCMDHDDTLAPHAIETLQSVLSAHPETEILYSDEDKIDGQGVRFDPFFKPDFSAELLESYNYVNHLSVFRKDTVHAVGGWRSRFDGAQDFDLVLRVVERAPPGRVLHVPSILYHWRAIPGSTALNIGFKPWAIEAGRAALEDHLQRSGKGASAHLHGTSWYRVKHQIPDPAPLVSIIIPTRDRSALLRECLRSIRENTSYPRYQVIIVDNGSSEADAIDLLNEQETLGTAKVLRVPGPFNFSALNNEAVREAKGDFVCLLNNDTEIITPEWLEEMVGRALQPNVGCVGPKLLYKDGSVQHGGVLLGVGGADDQSGVAGHTFLHHSRFAPSHFARLIVAGNYSAVTGACLLVRRDIYQQVGGLDERELSIAFNDIDFCLKVRALGFRTVYTPFAELYHLESISRGREDTPEKVARFSREAQAMRRKWGQQLLTDPFYSPHLSLQDLFKVSLSDATERLKASLP